MLAFCAAFLVRRSRTYRVPRQRQFMRRRRNSCSIAAIHAPQAQFMQHRCNSCAKRYSRRAAAIHAAYAAIHAQNH